VALKMIDYRGVALASLWLSLLLGTLCAAPASAYDEWYVKRLHSLVLAHDVDISVEMIKTRFFNSIKPGDDIKKKARQLVEGDEVDRALSFGGRVPQNIESLLRDKLQREFGIKPFAHDGVTSAPYQLSVDVSVNQGFNMFGEPNFVVSVLLELRERGTGSSGIHGYIETNFYAGIAGAKTKREVEGQIFVALEEAWKNLSKTMKEPREYCSNNDCSK
jgi:hypothetical protein